MITSQIFSSDGSLLTNHQASIIKDYTIQTFDSGVLKKIEEYHNSALYNGSYFMDDNENLQDIVNDLVVSSEVAWGILMNRKSANSYSQWDLNKYAGDGQLAWKAIQVLNSQNFPIMFMPTELATFGPGPKPRKYYYRHNSGDCVLMFEYYNDGTLYEVYDIDDNWGCAWRGMRMNEFLESSIAYDFSFDDHKYYQSLQPYLPISETL